MAFCVAGAGGGVSAWPPVLKRFPGWTRRLPRDVHMVFLEGGKVWAVARDRVLAYPTGRGEPQTYPLPGGALAFPYAAARGTGWLLLNLQRREAWAGPGPDRVQPLPSLPEPRRAFSLFPLVWGAHDGHLLLFPWLSSGLMGDEVAHPPGRVGLEVYRVGGGSVQARNFHYTPQGEEAMARTLSLPTGQTTPPLWVHHVLGLHPHGLDLIGGIPVPVHTYREEGQVRFRTWAPCPLWIRLRPGGEVDLGLFPLDLHVLHREGPGLELLLPGTVPQVRGGEEALRHRLPPTSRVWMAWLGRRGDEPIGRVLLADGVTGLVWNLPAPGRPSDFYPSWPLRPLLLETPKHLHLLWLPRVEAGTHAPPDGVRFAVLDTLPRGPRWGWRVYLRLAGPPPRSVLQAARAFQATGTEGVAWTGRPGGGYTFATASTWLAMYRDGSRLAEEALPAGAPPRWIPRALSLRET